MQTGTLQPLSLGELIDRALDVFRHAWRPLLVIALVGGAPEILGQVYGALVNLAFVPLEQAASGQELLLGILKGRFGGSAAAGSMAWPFTLLGAIVTPLIQGTTIFTAARAFLGRPVSLTEAFRVGRGRYWALVGTSLLMAILFVIPGVVGFLLLRPVVWLWIPILVIGGTAAAIYWTFPQQAIILEDESGGMSAISRSVALVKGRFWPLLLAVLVIMVLSFLVDYIAVLLVDLTFGMLHSLVLKSTLSDLLLALVRGITTAALSAFPLVCMTALYYDTRMRKEGLDLELAVETNSTM